MTDDVFLRELEACTLSERAFGHHAHMRAAYLYLGQSNFAEALVRMRRSICAFATHLGRPDRYQRRSRLRISQLFSGASSSMGIAEVGPCTIIDGLAFFWIGIWAANRPIFDTTGREMSLGIFRARTIRRRPDANIAH